MSATSFDPQAILNDSAYVTVLISDFYFSVITFYLYDILLKMPREIELIWTTRPKTTTFLYITARYATLPRLLIQVLPLQHDAKICDPALYTEDALYILGRASCLAVLTLQVWAIYSHDRRIIFVLGLLSLAVVIGEVLEVVASTCYTDGPEEVIWEKTSILLDAIMAAIVMLLSMYKLRLMVDWADWRESIRSFGTKTQCIYFDLVVSESLRRLATCALCIFQAIFIWAAPGGLSFYPIPFVKPIQALLICSLLLDLHKAQEDSNLKTQTSFLLTTVIQFNPEPHESSWELARMSESRATSHTLGKARGARTEEVDCT